MPLYEPVAYYHHHKNYLKGKTEYIDEEDEDDSDVEIYHDDEKRGFVSSNSHYYENALSSRHQRSVRLLESSRGGKPSIPSFQYACCKNTGPIKMYEISFIIDYAKDSHLFSQAQFCFFVFRKAMFFGIFQFNPLLLVNVKTNTCLVFVFISKKTQVELLVLLVDVSR